MPIFGKKNREKEEAEARKRAAETEETLEVLDFLKNKLVTQTERLEDVVKVLEEAAHGRGN